MQPWGYAHLPMPWIEGAMRADETWAYSRFVRDIYVRSGVRNEKLRVLPLGFNPLVFRREGPHHPVGANKKVRLLFVGGALDRKGMDLLLDVYVQAFTRQDDICLIIKDMGTATVYRVQTLKERIRKIAADPNAPEIH